MSEVRGTMTDDRQEQGIFLRLIADSFRSQKAHYEQGGKDANAVGANVGEHGGPNAVGEETDPQERKSGGSCPDHREYSEFCDVEETVRVELGVRGVGDRWRDVPQSEEKRCDHGGEERGVSACQHAEDHPTEQNFFVERRGERDANKRLEQDESRRVLDHLCVVEHRADVGEDSCYGDGNGESDDDQPDDHSTNDEPSLGTILSQTNRCPCCASPRRDEHGDSKDPELERDVPCGVEDEVRDDVGVGGDHDDRCYVPDVGFVGTGWLLEPHAGSPHPVPVRQWPGPGVFPSGVQQISRHGAKVPDTGLWRPEPQHVAVLDAKAV